MERRTFIKLMATSSAACWIGAAAAANMFLFAKPAEAVGPELVDGLSINPTGEGVEAFRDGQVVFTADETGGAMLALADGSASLQAIIERAGVGDVEAAVLFFVELGEAGYLKNRVEVNLVEARM